MHTISFGVTPLELQCMKHCWESSEEKIASLKSQMQREREEVRRFPSQMPETFKG